MRASFDTTAFFPLWWRRRGIHQGSWQRYTLEVDAARWEKLQEKRDELQEEANRTGQEGKLRRWERDIVRRYSV